MDRVSGRRLGAERTGRRGVEPALREAIGGAPRPREEALLFSHLPSHLSEADDRDDGLGAARGGMIAVPFGLLAWTLILFSVRRLLS